MSITPASYVTNVVELIAEYLVATGNARAPITQNVGGEYSNSVFEIRSYDWDDEAPYAPNFYFVEFGYSLDWYKHIGRGNEASHEISITDAIYMLNRCLTSIDYNEVVPFSEDLTWDPDWGNEPDDEY